MEAAEAACDLVFFGHFVIEVVFQLCGLVFVVVLLASAASGQRWLELRTARAVFGFFRGE